ncbi:MAG: nucleotidyltransferase domain-containing protein [Chloroflexota bacterium]|nr:nucleotidyltransferase domain-containing protein [Chloroflexota bacterium]
MDTSDNLVDALRQYLPQVLKGMPVQLAYLHGSAARGEMTPSTLTISPSTSGCKPLS